MLLKLNNMRDNYGANKKIKLLGRGIGSGLGKTSGRGGKGQTARSGVSLNGFEGGQTPLHRRLPKRGFKNNLALKRYELDFKKISRIKAKNLLKDGTIVNKEFLIKIGYMPKYIDEVSLISNGKIDFPVVICVARASASAKKNIELVGGSLILESRGQKA